MTGWLDQPLFALDTETTGTNPETARVVQSASASGDSGA